MKHLEGQGGHPGRKSHGRPGRWGAIPSAVLLLAIGCGSHKTGPEKNVTPEGNGPAGATDSNSGPKATAEKPSTASGAMTIQVPHTKSHQTCHDTLEKEAPDLLAAFRNDVVTAANGAGTAWQRLERTLAKADEVWGRHLQSGGNPRTSESSWICTVADLGEALVEASIAEAKTMAGEERSQRLRELKALVEEKFAEAPNQLSMILALGAAQSE